MHSGLDPGCVQQAQAQAQRLTTHQERPRRNSGFLLFGGCVSVLNPYTDLMTTQRKPIDITIWHRVDGGNFRPFSDHKTPALERAYEYTVPADQATDEFRSEPHTNCFRVNNAVDGTEHNCVAEKRSLSVGDIVQVGRHIDDTTFWSVESFGFEMVFAAEVHQAVGRGCAGSVNGKPNAVQRNPETGEFWVNEMPNGWSDCN